VTLSTPAVPSADPSRSLLIGAACLAALACGCGRDRTAADVVREGAIAWLPKESVGLVVVEVRALRGRKGNIDWMEEIESLGHEGGPLNDVQQRFGAEAFAGLDRVGLAIVPEVNNRVAYGIVTDGTFDEAKMRAAIGAEPIVTLREAEGDGPDLSLTILPGGRPAAGPRAVLERVRASAARPGDGLVANSRLLDRLQEIRPGSQVWGALDSRSLGELTRDYAAQRGLQASPLASASQFSSLVSIAFQGWLGETVQIDLSGKADSEAHARSLADAARGLLALGRMAAGNQAPPGVIDLLDGIRVDQQSDLLLVHASVAEKSLAALADQVVRDAAPAPGSGTSGVPPAN
jgi:hypothetical protein